MNPPELKLIIREEVIKFLLEESLINLDDLRDGISTSTSVGNHWLNLISSLEGIINETKDFKDLYSSKLHGPLPNTGGAMIQLQTMLKLIQSIKPVVLGMDSIQRKDI